MGLAGECFPGAVLAGYRGKSLSLSSPSMVLPSFILHYRLWSFSLPGIFPLSGTCFLDSPCPSHGPVDPFPLRITAQNPPLPRPWPSKVHHKLG